MLDAADVVVDRHEAVGCLARERELGVMRVGVAQVVPAGAGEGVHGVSLAAGRGSAHGAGGLVKLAALGERLTCAEVEVLGQGHRQLVLGYGDDAAVLTVDGRNGITPVALTGDEPVA